MKKLYTSILILAGLQANSQITITQSDLPVVGTYYINATDSNYVAPVPAGGAGQTWNYAGLLNNAQDTLGFMSSVGTPYAANFPSANLAGYDASTNSWLYFISDGTGFYINGGYTNAFLGGIVLKYNPAQLIVPVPFTYNSTRASNYRFEYKDTTSVFSGNPDSVRYIISGDIDMLGDGYGSLTLPNATYPNTIRIKSTNLQSDTIQIKIPIVGWTTITTTQTQSTSFRWLKNGGGSLVLEISADSLGTTSTTSSYLLTSGVVGVSNISESAVNLNVYPSPAKDLITFQFDERPGDDAQLLIYNAHGALTETRNVANLDMLTIGVNTFSNGIYFYSVRSENTVTSQGKFVVSR